MDQRNLTQHQKEVEEAAGMPLDWGLAAAYDLGAIDKEYRAQREMIQRPFQERVKPWLIETFGEVIANDKMERNHRFIEEALELVQSLGCTREECIQLVNYVYDRPVGEPKQETGGTMVTLAALCLANNLDMHEAGDTELERVWTKVEEIREKQKNKPRNSPLAEETYKAQSK